MPSWLLSPACGAAFSIAASTPSLSTGGRLSGGSAATAGGASVVVGAGGGVVSGGAGGAVVSGGVVVAAGAGGGVVGAGGGGGVVVSGGGVVVSGGGGVVVAGGSGVAAGCWVSDDVDGSFGCDAAFGSVVVPGSVAATADSDRHQHHRQHDEEHHRVRGDAHASTLPRAWCTIASVREPDHVLPLLRDFVGRIDGRSCPQGLAGLTIARAGCRTGDRDGPGGRCSQPCPTPRCPFTECDDAE